MAITIPTYCSREDVKTALDIKETARNNAQVDRAIEAATVSVEGLTHRKFYPQTATRYFDWPNYQYARSWRLWLDHNELISVTSLTAGGTSVPSSGYFLEPVNTGPPYTRIEMDLSTSHSFDSGDTYQRSVAVTGVFGYSNDTTNAASLSASASSSATTIDVDDGSVIGVGDLLVIDSERLICTNKTMLDTTQNLQSNMTAVQNGVTVAVTDGTAFAIGEILLLDAERMLIVDISGNNLTVKRAWDGTVLAAHTGSDIYALRTLTVVRGANGSTAATHVDSSTVAKVVVPPLIKELAVAEAVTFLAGESAAYARTTEGESNNAEDIGRGLRGLRDQAVRRYGRKARLRAV